MNGIRKVLALVLVGGSATLAFTPPANAECYQNDRLGVRHCSYQNGNCFYGGGRIGDRTIYFYNVGC